MWDVNSAIKFLLERGVPVDRCDFPPPPLPGLYDVGGHELTEGQVVDYAYRLNEGTRPSR